MASDFISEDHLNTFEGYLRRSGSENVRHHCTQRSRRRLNTMHQIVTRGASTNLGFVSAGREKVGVQMPPAFLADRAWKPSIPEFLACAAKAWQNG
jgi:hypothetical protein